MTIRPIVYSKLQLIQYSSYFSCIRIQNLENDCRMRIMYVNSQNQSILLGLSELCAANSVCSLLHSRDLPRVTAKGTGPQGRTGSQGQNRRRGSSR